MKYLLTEKDQEVFASLKDINLEDHDLEPLEPAEPWNKGLPRSEWHYNPIMSDEARKRNSERMKKDNPAFKKEVRDKISKTLSGKPGASKGYKHTQEAKEKLSKAFKGKTRSQETKDKISKAGTGKKRSEETKRKMREAWQRRKGI